MPTMPHSLFSGLLDDVFDDVAPGVHIAAQDTRHLLGGGKAQQLYHEQSYGRLTLDVTVRSDLGWRRMSKHSTSYDFLDFKSQRSYISAAAGLFHPAEIRFSDYQMVLVVAADTPNFPLSPGFTPLVGDEASVLLSEVFVHLGRHAGLFEVAFPQLAPPGPAFASAMRFLA